MGRKHRNQRKRLRKLDKVKQKKASRTKIEAQVAQFLDCLGITYQQNCKIGRYNVDFLIDGKYIVECYGDFWHCSPKKYSPDYYNRGLKYEAQERWRRDELRQDTLESMGHQLLVLWETEIHKEPKYCKLRIKRLLTGNAK